MTRSGHVKTSETFADLGLRPMQGRRIFPHLVSLSHKPLFSTLKAKQSKSTLVKENLPSNLVVNISFMHELCRCELILVKKSRLDQELSVCNNRY
jgi:hypothetical protein